MLGNKKDEIKKSKKGKESIIGKIIYGFLLFMPLLAIASAILVNTFNNQAKDEVNIIYKYETNEVTSLDDLVVGNIYTADVSSMLQQDSLTADYFSFTFFDPDDEQYKIFISDLDNNQLMYLEYNDNHFRLDIDGYGDIPIYSILNNKVDFVYNTDSLYSWQTPITNISKCENIPIERVEQKNITNIFYEAVDEVENSPLFNWSKNSELYTVIHNTCNILDLSNTFIPMLMTYWVIISIIYVIYDIALIALHVVHRKIHELQDSI